MRDHPFPQTDDSPAYRSYSSLFSPFYQREGREGGGARPEKERNHISNPPLVLEKWPRVEKDSPFRTTNACMCVIPAKRSTILITRGAHFCFRGEKKSEFHKKCVRRKEGETRETGSETFKNM